MEGEEQNVSAVGRDAGLRQETEDPLRYDNPIYAPLTQYCHLLFFPSRDRYEDSKRQSNLAKMTAQREQTLDSTSSALLTTPRPVLEAQSIRITEGLAVGREGNTFPSRQPTFHCSEMQVFLQSKTGLKGCLHLCVSETLWP